LFLGVARKVNPALNASPRGKPQEDGNNAGLVSVPHADFDQDCAGSGEMEVMMAAGKTEDA
jgi:hypothetical protein